MDRGSCAALDTPEACQYWNGLDVWDGRMLIVSSDARITFVEYT